MKIKNLFIVLLLSSINIYAQKSLYYVDGSGVLRERSGNKEVAFAGVNYTLPFAHAYRMHKQLGVDLKAAIDKDVYHFARLGFNAFRLHVWDVEISDADGNLLDNEHLNLFDYLLSKLKERKIKIVLTPIAYWGNGYPEMDEKLPGFSSKGDKCDMTRNETAIKAQERYLHQFMNHVNPYTGKAIKADPDIVGIEINNEPCHATSQKEAKAYVNRMTNAIRGTGCDKPVFYNITQNTDHTQAILDSKIDGCTFQWYPTGLVSGHTRQGNFLPAVDRYTIPFDKNKSFKNKCRIIYEFDAADVAAPYIYPAIARSFRSAGFQWVTQFAYDPLEMAWANTEYQTHYMNLAYAPQKAISYKIAAEAVRSIPRFASFGSYPIDTIFGDFRVSYKESLSELNSSDKFFYSNNTKAIPKDISSLKEVAGCGTSSVVSYQGTGAYFLDKLSDGVWRLEVMPDNIWTSDPFAKTSMKKDVSTIHWREWPITIFLPDLGDTFSFTAINDGNSRKGNAQQSTITTYPGVYLLKRQGVSDSKWTAESTYKQISLKEFVAPAERVKSFTVLHKSAIAIDENSAYKIDATVVGPTIPDSVMLYVHHKGEGWWRNHPLRMNNSCGYGYEAVVPAKRIGEGTLAYVITVYKESKSYSFPANCEGNPSDWDYNAANEWTTLIQKPDKFITLFDAKEDFNALETYYIDGKQYQKKEVVGEFPSEHLISIKIDEPSAEGNLLLRQYVKDKIDGRRHKLADCKYLAIQLNNTERVDSLKFGLISDKGLTYRTTVNVSGGKQVLRIPVTQLSLGETMIQPEGYPSFLPDTFQPQSNIPLNIQNIEFFEIMTGKHIMKKDFNIQLMGVWFE
nr:cellulase family glycosylhydrolase [uncultured Bacteroides sp.]